MNRLLEMLRMQAQQRQHPGASGMFQAAGAAAPWAQQPQFREPWAQLPGFHTLPAYGQPRPDIGVMRPPQQPMFRTLPAGPPGQPSRGQPFPMFHAAGAATTGKPGMGQGDFQQKLRAYQAANPNNPFQKALRAAGPIRPNFAAGAAGGLPDPRKLRLPPAGARGGGIRDAW